MVKKLLKYEFYSIGRIILPFAIIVPAAALFSGLTFLISREIINSTYLSLLSSLLTGLFTILIFSFVITAFVLCIVRFRNSLFSKEGYFTLSLPVTGGQLLFSKLFTYIVALVFTFAVSLLSGALFFAINGVNLFREIADFANGVFGSDWWVVAYLLFCLLVYALGYMLFICACIAAGQLVNKHRALLSVGVYFIGSQIASIPLTLIELPLIEVLEAAILTESGVVMGLASIAIIQPVVLGLISVFFIRWILRNKVNIQA